MSLPDRTRRWTRGFLAGFVALLSTGSLAQVAVAPVTRPEDTVTTVSPLIVTPGGPAAPIPPITTQQLSQSALTAHDMAIGSLSSICNQGVSEDEENLEFPMRRASLAFTDARASAYLETAAKQAQAATAAVQAARSGGSPQAIEAAEVTRQTAIRAYLSAQKLAVEAHQRFVDFQDIAIPDWSPRYSGWPRRLAALRHMPWTGWIQTRPPTPPPDAEIMALLDENTRQRLDGAVVTGVYIPAEYADLRLTGVAARPTTLKGGAKVLRVTGRIVNPRRAPISIPPLWVTVVDEYNQPLKSDQVKAGASRKIPPGGSLAFNYDLKPVPDGGLKTLVTFAPQEKTRRDQPIPGSSGFCPQDSAQIKQFHDGVTPPPEANWINGGQRRPTTHPWAFDLPILPSFMK